MRHLILGLLLLSCLSINLIAGDRGTTCSKFKSNACVCNDPDPCPLIESIGTIDENEVVIYKTGEGSKDRLTRYDGITFENLAEV